MYTIQQKNKTIGMSHNERHYVVGFKSSKLARKVQYALHPEPKLILVRGTDIDLSKDLQNKGINDLSLIVDTEATLFMPKFKGSSEDPLNDGGYHLHNVLYKDFVTYPFTKMIGVIMPYDLLEENEEEFVFRSHVIEPSFHPKLFG